jgi:DNA polymerase
MELLMICSENSSRKEAMNQVAKDIRECDKCGVSKDCTNKVIGEGNLASNLVFIGEAPGKNEDETGRPFVGTAGSLLDDLLEESNIDRRDIYITNILKCRPPGNRKPRRAEIEECLGHLDDQLNIIKPKVIAPMGNVATRVFFDIYDIEKSSIGAVHGKVYHIETKWGKAKLVPLYHPAAAIYNRNLKPELVKDLRKVSKLA